MGRPHLCVADPAGAVRDLPGPRRPEARCCQQSRCECKFGNQLEHSREVRPAQGESVSAKWGDDWGYVDPLAEAGVGKLQTWLDGGGKSPKNQVLKRGLREMLRHSICFLRDRRTGCGLKSSFWVVDPPAMPSPPELEGGCCLERPAGLIVSRHGAGTDVIDPAMEGKIPFFQPSCNRGM
jgi:hypothetical protein